MPNTLAYGFVTLEHLLAQRVAGVGVARIYDAVRESAAEHSRMINGLMAGFVGRTATAQEQFELPAGGTLQPLDESGNPLPVRPSGSYQVAYPIQGGGTAWGGNRVSNALMTVEEANRFTIDAQQKDADWLRRHILAAVLTNTTWTYNDKVGANGGAGLGNITVQPLANNDAVTFVRKGGSIATDNHYLAQAVNIADGANPFPTIYDELMEHPSNDGPVVVYVSTNLKPYIMALANFVEMRDPDIQPGSGSATLVGSLERGFGDAVLGKTDNCWIVEWSALPSGYMLAHATGAGPVLKMREYPSEKLQGFFAENHSPDGNHMEYRMIRYAGFGVANRVAAVAYMIGGGGTYQNPSGLTAPLAV